MPPSTLLPLPPSPEASSPLAPEIDLLVRRWKLPAERINEVKLLCEAQNDGATAVALTASSPNTSGAWGPACYVVPTDGILPLSPHPLILRRHQDTAYLQSWRFFQAEQAIARDLLARAAQPAPSLTRPAVNLIADPGGEQLNPRQADAITCALSHTLALITGGPGTGKTHTLARLLALLIADQPAALEIRLAAPTGKAAERMKEAIEGAAERLPATLPKDIPARLKTTAKTATTLHSLLGFNSGTGRCRYNDQNPLGCDVLIVDECSMVDTLMWQALLVALPTTTRLILLGDPNQLESVSAGDVLGALVRHARVRPASLLGKVWTELNESQRFQHRQGIGALAEAVVHNQAEAAVALLRANHHKQNTDLTPPDHSAAPVVPPAATSGLVWLGDLQKRFNYARLPEAVSHAITAVADAATPLAALAALSRVRVLTANREFSMGVSGINSAIEQHLLSRATPPPHDRPTLGNNAHNQPIIINHNDPETGLTNGTVGVIMSIPGRGRVAYFPAADSTEHPRVIQLSQLPDHGLAWAMTIHRSQGSEFNHVVVILPNNDSALATRELIYTAITRAKDWVHVWGAEATMRQALNNHSLRCTLLESHL